MQTFAEIIEKVEGLSMNELEEMRRAVNRKLIEKKREEILEASEQALKEYKEGKTTSLNSEEEIRKFFTELMKEND